MFDMPVEVPDRISMLELSKIWLYKALQELEQERQASERQAGERQTSERQDSQLDDEVDENSSH